MTSVGVLVCLVLGLGWSSLSYAAGNDDTGSQSEDRDLVKVRIHTESPEAETGIFHLKKKIAIIEPPQGHVEILIRDSQLIANKLIYDQSDDTAELIGDVAITQKDSYAKADNMRADFNREIYILEGNVYFKQQETEGETTGATKLELWSGWMQVEDTGKRLLAKGQVRLIEADRRAWADELEYDDEQETAILIGDVRLETNDGNVLTGTKVVINLSTDEAVVYGPTYAEFVMESDSETSE